MRHESNRTFSFLIEGEDTGSRLDVFLTSRIKELTRSRIQELIKSGYVEVNARAPKAGYRLQFGDRVQLVVPPVRALQLEPEQIDLGLIHEDASLIVLNKPPGLVVHPAPGHPTGTLVHGLLHHCRDLSGIGGILRPGIVHRLDKDTSGLIVVAKNDRVHHWLSGQFSKGEVRKRYLALVHGIPGDSMGKIEAPIARHPKKRKEMTVVQSGGKWAFTNWERIRVYGTAFALLSASPKTGRTHQIRVHLTHLGHPIVGDPVYGRRRDRGLKDTGVLKRVPRPGRQMLHAETLAFVHPETKKYCEFHAPLPIDMADILNALEELFPEDFV